MPLGSADFFWTAAEIRTQSGFHVAPGHQNPNKEETTYLVLRYRDGTSSKLCAQIEAMALSSGGIVIYDSGAISRGFSGEYRTGLFHRNCRCRLMPKPKGIMTPEIDRTDMQMAVGDSSLAKNEADRFRETAPDDVYDKFNSADYRQRVNNVFNLNMINNPYPSDSPGQRFYPRDDGGKFVSYKSVFEDAYIGGSQ